MDAKLLETYEIEDRLNNRYEKCVGPKKMAEILGVSVSWIYSRTRTKEIPFYKIGKYVRFKPSEVIQWFKK